MKFEKGLGTQLLTRLLIPIVVFLSVVGIPSLPQALISPSPVMAAAIDVGPGATDRTNETGVSGKTYVDIANPANGTGNLTSFEIWANGGSLLGVIVGTYYGSGFSWTCRDSEYVGTVTTGYHDLSVNLDVHAGDVIGFYAGAGSSSVELDTTGGTGVARTTGNCTTPDSNYSFDDKYADWAISIYATGATEEDPGHVPTTYYVDATGGSDANAGNTTLTAWQTLEKVNETTLYSGDTVLFKRGETFDGHLDIIYSGASDNAITYSAYDSGDNPIIDASSNTSGIIWTANYVNLDNLVTVNATSHGFAISNSGNITLADVESNDNGGDGFYLNNVTGIITDNLTADGNTGSGWHSAAALVDAYIDGLTSVYNVQHGALFEGTGSSNITITSGNLSFNSVATSSYNGLSFKDTGNSANVTYTTSAYNGGDGFNIHDTWTDTDFWYVLADTNGVDGGGADGDGLSYHETCTGTVKYSTFRNNFKSGACNINDSVTSFHYCLFSHATAGTLGLVGAFGSANMTVHNCVIYSETDAGSGVYSTLGGANPFIEIRNSIITNCATGLQSDNLTIIDSDYNVVWGNSNDYNTVTPGAHDIDSDPLLVNPPIDFSLSTGSPAINAGVDVGLTEDFIGNPVTGNPDIGAYEYQGINSPSVTTNAASIVEETTATLNGEITDDGSENCTRGFAWGLNAGGVLTDNWSEGVYDAGAYSHGISGSTEGTGYIYHATANNTAGSDNGTIVFFLTKPDEATSFNSTGNGTNWISASWTNGAGMDYVSIRYSTASYPTDNISGTHGHWGSGTTANITGLDPNDTYYFSIFTYATENATWTTADIYATMTDTTDSEITGPTVTTGAATGVTGDDAKLNGTITSDGGASCNVTWYWDTTDYGQTDNWTNSATQTSQSAGAISYTITDNLTASTLYYFIVKVINEAGTGWGSTLNFTTTDGAESSFTPPTQGTDNATDVILWFGEGLDIDSLTIEGLEDATTAMEGLTIQAGVFNVIMRELSGYFLVGIGLMLALGFSWLTFRVKDQFLYIVSALVISSIAFSWLDDYFVLQIAVYGLGLYLLFTGVIMTLAGDSGRGADWFKSMAGKIKGMITK